MTQGTAPTIVHQARIKPESENFTLEAEKQAPFALMIFHHWLRYTENEARAMYTENWRQEEENSHVLV